MIVFAIFTIWFFFGLFTIGLVELEEKRVLSFFEGMAVIVFWMIVWGLIVASWVDERRDGTIK